MYILVLDGDDYSNRLVHFILTKEGYEVEVVDNPVGALQIIQRREPSLIILEVILPSMDGFQFAENLHAKGYQIPLLFITTQDAVKAKLKHFNIGTNDYIRKPYNHQELVARVQEQEIMLYDKKGRDISSRNKQKLRVGNIEFIPKDLKVIVEGKSVMLTRTEAQVFSVLVNNFNESIKREKILMEVWNDNNCNTNIVDVYIWRLRSKIEEGLGRPKYITSIRGVGYKFTGG